MPSPTFNVKNKILRAGAGAGKTTTLTNTFLEFADDFKKVHQRFPNIVVTTFTRKATQELKERLLSKALEKDREDLFHYVSSKTQVQISTIHGILSLYLSRNGSAMGFTPDFQILSESEDRTNARKILRRILLDSESGQELLEEYDFKTLEDCFLQYYDAKFIYPALRPVTAEELEDLVTSKLQEHLQKLRSFCENALAVCSNDKWVTYLENWQSFQGRGAEETWSSYLERIQLFEESNTKPAFRKASPPFDETLHEDLDAARKAIKSFLQNPANQETFWKRHQKNAIGFQSFAQKFYEEFLKSKIKSGLISMGDLELFSLKLMQEFPQTAESFSQEWDFWMIDEYQDTSPVQVRLLRSLVGRKPVFIVGDPQQSIYLFRGARSQVFQEKIEEVTAQQGDVEVKLVNYRSNPEVLNFFNHYFTKLSPQFAAMTPAPDKQLQQNPSAVVDILVTESSEEDQWSSESLAAIARVQELLAGGTAPEQICILGRTHRTLEDIAKVAHEYGIPYQLHSGSGFYQRREILDALSLLKFFMNPHDNPNLVALLRSPWLYLSDSEIIKICHGGSHSYWIQSLKNIDQMREDHPLRILRKLQQEVEKGGLAWALRTALVELGYFDYTLEIDSSGRREANLWKLVTMLSSEERRPGFNFLDFLDVNLATLSTDEGGEDADATPIIEPKRVNLMTVHASKGLQFDHVILPGMGQAARPSTLPMLSIRESNGLWTLKLRDLEDQTFIASGLAQLNSEELRNLESQEFNRVLYVALTRAKAGVTLIWDRDYKSKSWAAEVPLVLDEGEHQEKGFKYRVRQENLKPLKFEKQALERTGLRSPWAPTNAEAKWQSVSVTQIVEGESFPEASFKGKSSDIGTALARAQQGTDAHRLFESLKFSSFEEVLAMSDVPLRRPLEFMAETRDLPLLEIIQRGQVEWGFTFRHGKNLIQGQIDLWGVIDNVLWVVDYKTGSQKYSEMALRQLEVYAWALYKMKVVGNVNKVSLAIVYPLDEVVKIKDFTGPDKLWDQIEGLISKNVP